MANSVAPEMPYTRQGIVGSNEISGLELEGKNKEELVKLSPEFYGIGINLKVLYKTIKDFLNFKKQNKRSKN